MFNNKPNNKYSTKIKREPEEFAGEKNISLNEENKTSNLQSNSNNFRKNNFKNKPYNKLINQDKKNFLGIKRENHDEDMINNNKEYYPKNNKNNNFNYSLHFQFQ